MFGSLWSEHCGYKNSKPLLHLFPSGGAHVLTKGGEENAGAIDIGDGLCVVMKIESHNHPSAIEPYQGAATGVGGIVRDIFAMGVRPIALLDSLRFGPPDDPQNRYLFNGVVGGIGGYGNCLGIPTVGGEVLFRAPTTATRWSTRCASASRKRTARQREGRGRRQHPAARWRRHGPRRHPRGQRPRQPHRPEARFEEMRPAVQVGNPFLEKLLMEACFELASEHGDWIVGLQDLGAAGLTSSAVESRQGRHRHRHRPRERAAPRGRDDAVRSHALRDAGAHADHRREGHADDVRASSTAGSCTARSSASSLMTAWWHPRRRARSARVPFDDRSPNRRSTARGRSRPAGTVETQAPSTWRPAGRRPTPKRERCCACSPRRTSPASAASSASTTTRC